MTAQQPGPRIVPPEEAARLYAEAAPGDWSAGADGIEGRRFVAGPDVPPYGVQSPHGITVMDEGDAALIAAAPDLAHTVAVLGEQREAGRALHRGSHWCSDANGRAYFDRDHTCPTARALGVTE